jgi:uncharacterized protein YdbL (DUF1318 family)
MRSKIIGAAVITASLCLVLACITVNIYFPEAAVRQAASEIVDEVRQQKTIDKEAAEPAIRGRGTASRSGGFSLVPAAFALQETSVSNPTIRALKDSLKLRFPDLRPFYDGGQIGEINTGFVEVRDDGGLGLKDKAALRDLVRDENSDRTRLYAEVAKALGIEESQIGRIQKIFAASWIDNAAPGWWVQNEAGEWAKKPS